MSNEDQFLDHFRSLFDETDINEINLSTKYKDLKEWGSLSVLSLIITAEEQYKFDLLPVEIDKADSVNDLYEIFKAKSPLLK